MDLPGDVHGAPTVQIAQAFQQKCAAAGDGSTERYRIGATDRKLVVTFDKEGRRHYGIEEGGKNLNLKPRVLESSNATMVMFNDRSRVQFIHLKAPSGKSNPQSKYVDPQGKSHVLVPETPTLLDKKPAGVVPAPCVS